MLARVARLAAQPAQALRCIPPAQHFSTQRAQHLAPRLLHTASPLRPTTRPHLRHPARTPASLSNSPPRRHAGWQSQAYRRFGAGQRGSSIGSLWANSHAFRRTIYLGGGALTLFVGYNMEQVPGSGRWRFNFVSAAQEAALSAGQYEQLRHELSDRILPAHSAEAQRVRRVLERLLPHASLAATPTSSSPTYAPWTIDVVSGPEANAFVLPGGHVFVFSGILPLCGDDAGLATVLGHEIAHAAAHHAAEQISRNAALALAAMVFGLLYDVSGGVSWRVLDLALNRPGSRAQEREADHLGLLIMARACFDPDAALAFWDRMQRHEARGQPPQFLSTHPSHGARVKAIRDWLPEARSARDGGACGPVAEYADAFRRAVPGW